MQDAERRMQHGLALACLGGMALLFICRCIAGLSYLGTVGLAVLCNIGNQPAAALRGLQDRLPKPDPAQLRRQLADDSSRTPARLPAGTSSIGSGSAAAPPPITPRAAAGSGGNSSRGAHSGLSSAHSGLSSDGQAAAEEGGSMGLTGRVAAQVMGLQKQMSRAMQSLASLGRGDGSASRSAAAAAVEKGEAGSKSEEEEESGVEADSEAEAGWQQQQQQQRSPEAGAAGTASSSAITASQQQQQLSETPLASLQALLGPGAWDCPLISLLLDCCCQPCSFPRALHQPLMECLSYGTNLQEWRCAWQTNTSATTQVG